MGVDVVPFHFSDDVQVFAGVKEIRFSSISWLGVTRLAVRDLLEDRIDVVTAQRIGADGLDVEGDPAIVGEAFITAVHGAGLSLHVWTVDDPVVARYFHALGVNSITTNRPKELRAALTRPGSEK